MTKNYKRNINGITKYNHFLSSLDRNANNNKTKNNINDKISNISLEQILKEIDDAFINVGYYESLLDKQINISNNKIKWSSYSKQIAKNNNQSPKKIKQQINIDIEINNIDDILKIINTYPINDTNEYNINVSALHKIKEPLEELNKMIGIQHIKSNIIYQILYFIQDLHIVQDTKESKESNDKDTNGQQGDFMHTVLYGPPGTGKTEIAKILGKIYSKLGILSKGTFRKVTRSDLVAGYLGQTAIKTSEVIKESLGGVLFIDEAYSLGNSEKKDSFSKECIDTLCEALSNYKNDLMVIIAGYEEDLHKCLFAYNQGLSSRFVWRYKIEKYTGEDMYNIFLKKINEINWCIQNNDDTNMKEWFIKNVNYFKYFGRDIEILLFKTKIAHSKRIFCKPKDEKKIITIDDLERGLKLFVENEEIQNRLQSESLKKQIFSSMYS